MNDQQLCAGLARFLDASPCAFDAAGELTGRLAAEGFEPLALSDGWVLTPGGKYYVPLGDNAVIAFRAGRERGFMIAAAHTDSPCFHLKPNPVMKEGGVVKLNVEPYGGMLYYSWLDRPLALCGRAIFESGSGLTVRRVLIRGAAVIPSLAIHLNREANKSLALNPQTDLLPVVTLGGEFDLEAALADACGESGRLLDHDLFLCADQPARTAGLHGELLVSPRLDDLASLYGCTEAFFAADCPATAVLCAFSSEEIGSRTFSGAGSTAQAAILGRISAALGHDPVSDLADSFLVSADNAHAAHPNAGAKSDPTNQVRLGGGVVIKHHDHYTTNGYTAAVFKELCRLGGADWQDFASRSDGSCGGTLGVVSLGQVTVPSVDIGIPQLAMHAAVETMAWADLGHFTAAMKSFYSHRVVRRGDRADLL